MTKEEVMKELESLGNPGTKKILIRHGAREPFHGVKVQDLKKIVKKIKKDHALSLELYETGNSDAMYLAGLIADESKITKSQLKKWAKQAYWYMLAEFTVPWVAADSPHGWDLGLEWIESKNEGIASCGWATISSWISIQLDEELDMKKIEELLKRAGKEVHDAQNRVRYVMNNYIIAVGTYIPKMTKKAQAIAEKVGKVQVNVGETSCKVPLAETYIQKNIDKGRIGKKRKMARC